MIKFDSDNNDHTALFNSLANAAARAKGGFATTGNWSVYYSDCIRDVEFLMGSVVGSVFHWVVSDTSTWITSDRDWYVKLTTLNKHSARFEIEHCVTEYGTRWFAIRPAE